MSKLPSVIFAMAVLGAYCAGAQAAPSGYPGATIHGSADDSKLTVLRGNTRPEARSANDAGAVDDSMPMGHLLLQLKRSPEREAALQQYIKDLHTPGAASYHQWLTPDDFAAHYGVAQSDVAAVSSWLIAKGFSINGVTASGLMIDFSGTAGLVKEAFHTEIHQLQVKGVTHFANMSDPQIPAALVPAVGGVMALHNFHPKPLLVRKSTGAARPGYDTGTSPNPHGLTPGDLATIYNLAPLFAAGYSGKGQTIMVVEDAYLYSTTDWTVFRKTFGLTRAYPYGSLSQISPTGALTCTPAVPPPNAYRLDSVESAIDVEWASAAAPNAAIVLAACNNTSAYDIGFGGFIALENTLNGPAANLPSVVSISYGDSEPDMGAATNLAYNNAYEQAVSEGVSVFVASGDWDADVSDAGGVATSGLSVSGFASTPYNVAVGGTDFGYTADQVAPSTYWAASNSNSYSSALSYIQEIPWNNSCAGALMASFYGTTPLALCNGSRVTSPGGDLTFLQNASGGSGGASSCATGYSTNGLVVNGSCAGYAKPAWQAGLFGNPNDGVRDVPDVALFAANGTWDAYYVVCYSIAAPCTGAPSTWAGYGGTSVSSPIMAAIQALVNQKTGQHWGNPNTVYYQMAKAEFGGTGSATCNSITVNKTSNSCVFYDVTEGDNAGDCRGSINCYSAGNPFGVLSTSTTTLQPAFQATTGWDFTTGIGSLNAFNLVMQWPSN